MRTGKKKRHFTQEFPTSIKSLFSKDVLKISPDKNSDVDSKHEHFARDWSKNAYGGFKLNSRIKTMRKISILLK